MSLPPSPGQPARKGAPRLPRQGGLPRLPQLPSAPGGPAGGRGRLPQAPSAQPAPEYPVPSPSLIEEDEKFEDQDNGYGHWVDGDDDQDPPMEDYLPRGRQEYVEDDEDDDEDEDYEDEDYEDEQEEDDTPSPFGNGDYETPVVATPDGIYPSPSGFTKEVEESAAVLLQLIGGDESSEVLMNGPSDIMYKSAGARYHVSNIDFHDIETYHRVINEYLLPHVDTKERITDHSYLVEGQLTLTDDPNMPPQLARVHIVAPPVVAAAKVTIAKKSRTSLTVDDIVARGSMTRSMGEFLKSVARGRATIVFSGLSGAGKTTLLEAVSHHFDQNDRIVLVEDTPELRLPAADVVPMTTTSSKPGVDPASVVSMEWLVRMTNRMRPDRIIVGEVRGGEMGEFLVAANSGADGSMTTVHAADPRRTLDKVLGLAMKAEGAKSETSVSRDIASTIQLIIQLGLIDGRHVITHIEEVSHTIRQETGVIATTTIFEYDRATDRHIARNPPSEGFISFLGQRGVNLSHDLFR